MAALQGHQEVVRVLLEHGADVNTQDADCRTSLYILALENRVNMAKFLIDPGGADVEARDSEVSTHLTLFVYLFLPRNTNKVIGVAY